MIVELTLITITTEKDRAGFRKEKRHELNVIAEKKSVKRTEFYSAMKSNIIPKFTFVNKKIHSDNYPNEFFSIFCPLLPLQPSGSYKYNPLAHLFCREPRNLQNHQWQD